MYVKCTGGKYVPSCGSRLHASGVRYYDLYDQLRCCMVLLMGHRMVRSYSTGREGSASCSYSSAEESLYYRSYSYSD
jgi:hypothetical protein